MKLASLPKAISGFRATSVKFPGTAFTCKGRKKEATIKRIGKQKRTRIASVERILQETQNSWLRAILQRQSTENTTVLARKQTQRAMECNNRPVDKSSKPQLTNYWTSMAKSTLEKGQFIMQILLAIYMQTWNSIPTSHFEQNSTPDGPNTST